MHAIADLLWRIPLADHLAPSAVSPAAHLQRQRTIRVTFLLGAVAILNGIDLICTLFAQSVGMLDEVNPLASTFIDMGLTSGLVGFKILMVTSGAVLLWKLRRSTWCAGGCWVLFVAYGILGGMWWLWMRDTLYTLEVRMDLSGVFGAF